MACVSRWTRSSLPSMLRGTLAAGAPRLRIDVGIVTIKEEEFLALLDAFGVEATIHHGHLRDYQLLSIKTPHGTKRIAITRCLHQGNTFANAAATELLDDLDPEFVLVVGIAGGIPTPDFTLGDVVVSTDIVDLTVEDTGAAEGATRYGAKGLDLHNDAGRLVEQLPAILRGVPWPDLGPRPTYESTHTTDDDAWNKSIDEALAHHTESGRVIPVARPGGIASSDRLVKNPEIIVNWRSVLKGIAVAEMEAAGVGLACSRRHVPFLAVRGISDIIGWKRSEKWTKYACKTVAAAVRLLVESGALRRSGIDALPRPHIEAANQDLTKLFFSDWIVEIERAFSLEDWVAFSDDALRELLWQETIEGANRLAKKRFGANWPEELPELRNAITALVDALSDFVSKYVSGAELRPGGSFGPDASFKRYWNPNYEEFSEQQKVWSSECLWRLLHVVVKLNEFAHAVRKHYDATYRLTTGNFMLHDELGVFSHGEASVILPDGDLVARLRADAEQARRDFERKKKNREFRMTAPLPLHPPDPPTSVATSHQAPRTSSAKTRRRSSKSKSARPPAKKKKKGKKGK